MNQQPPEKDHEAPNFTAERRAAAESPEDSSLQAELDLESLRAKKIDGSAPRDIIEPEQIETRAAEFGLTAEELRLAIQKAGPAVEDINAHLAARPAENSRSKGWPHPPGRHG